MTLDIGMDIGPRCISSALWTFAFRFPSCVVSFPSLFQPSVYCTVYIIHICSLYRFIQYSGLYLLFLYSSLRSYSIPSKIVPCSRALIRMPRSLRPSCTDSCITLLVIPLGSCFSELHNTIHTLIVTELLLTLNGWRWTDFAKMTLDG